MCRCAQSCWLEPTLHLLTVGLCDQHSLISNFAATHPCPVGPPIRLTDSLNHPTTQATTPHLYMFFFLSTTYPIAVQPSNYPRRCRHAEQNHRPRGTALKPRHCTCAPREQPSHNTMGFGADDSRSPHDKHATSLPAVTDPSSAGFSVTPTR